MEVVYIVTNKDYNRVKVGFSRRKQSETVKRYKTFLGCDVEIQFFPIKNGRTLEKCFQQTFKERCISNELYEKAYIVDYCDFLLRKTRSTRKKIGNLKAF